MKMDREVPFSGGFCLMLALMLLILPLSWVIAALLAGFVHELCHYAAIRLCGGQAGKIRLYSFAAQIPLPPMSRSKELLCTLAGPFGGLSLLLLARWIPRTAICAAMQSLYNLLPIYPLDGGRALQCVLAMCTKPPTAQKIYRLTQAVCLFCVACVGFYGTFLLHLGLLPILIAGMILVRTKFVKTPCKLAQ